MNHQQKIGIHNLIQSYKDCRAITEQLRELRKQLAAAQRTKKKLKKLVGHDLATRYKLISPFTVDRIKELLQSGLSHRRIADLTGASAFTVRKVSRGGYDSPKEKKTQIHNQKMFAWA